MKQRPRSTPNRLVLSATLAALLAGVGAGYFAGLRSMQNPPDKEAMLPAAQTNARTAAAAPNGAALGESAGVAQAAEAGESAPDPRAALRQLREEKHPVRRRRVLDELCASLDARGARAILEALPRRLAPGERDRDIIGAVAGRWAELEPREAAEFAAHADQDWNTAAIYTVMDIWAEKDVAGAWQWAVQAPGRETRQYGMNAIIGTLAERDAGAALALIESLPSAESKSFYVSSLFERLAGKNPSDAAALALQMANEGLRQAAVAQVAQAWAQTDPARALAWFFQNSSAAGDWQSNADHVTGEILGDWVRRAPAEAAAFAGALPLGDSRSTLIASLGEKWGGADPAAAASWLQSLPRGSESARAFENLIGTWTENDPLKAGDFLLAQPGDRRRDELLDRFGVTWANEDPAAALAWARAHAEPELEHLVAAQAVGQMICRDLANVESHLAGLKTPKAQTEAIIEVSNSFVQRGDEESAAKWVMGVDAKHAVGRALEWPVANWTRKNPDAVAAWLNEQPTGGRRDAAVSSFANALAAKDAASAAAWAASIADDGMRGKGLKAVVRTWAGKDAAAARGWVAAQPLAPAQQQELLVEVERVGRK